jgi:hypothetical protein
MISFPDVQKSNRIVDAKNEIEALGTRRAPLPSSLTLTTNKGAFRANEP